MTRGRLLALVLVVIGVLFGLLGGEYSTLDWWQLHRQVKEQNDAIARLETEVDSLEAWADSLEHDRMVQERRAREKFGMMRDGEILYRVEGLER
jgi:cell division protein FtsB